MVLNVEDVVEMCFQPTVWSSSQTVKESTFNCELCTLMLCNQGVLARWPLRVSA